MQSQYRWLNIRIITMEYTSSQLQLNFNLMVKQLDFIWIKPVSTKNSKLNKPVEFANLES